MVVSAVRWHSIAFLRHSRTVALSLLFKRITGVNTYQKLWVRTITDDSTRA